MLPLIFIIVVTLGLVTAYRLLWPEMYVQVPKSRFSFPWRKPHLRADLEPPAQIVVDAPRLHEPESSKYSMNPATPLEKINKLEALLLEKNKVIDRLQTQIDNERQTRLEFENVKSIMDEEINHLREQLRAFRNYYKERTDA